MCLCATTTRKKNKDLHFYVIPKDRALRKECIRQISRKDFTPGKEHRVCSAHFEGGKKTYDNNIPTIVPKTIKPSKGKERTSRNSLGLITTNETFGNSGDSDSDTHLGQDLSEPCEENMPKEEIQVLREELSSLKTEYEENTSILIKENEKLKNELKMYKFTIDRFKHKNEQFKFYTGFPNYQLFTALLNFLKPAADQLYYWGNFKQENNIKETDKKLGRPRMLSTEEEFFLVLVRLRGNYPLEDLSVRFNMSDSNVSRILITWYDFLHTQLRGLPIWASRKTVDSTMPPCFQVTYPKTRVILDCSEIFTEVPSSYRCQSATFSNYKHHNTLKALVGIAPSGAVTFVSDAYTGRSSDK